MLSHASDPRSIPARMFNPDESIGIEQETLGDVLGVYAGHALSVSKCCYQRDLTDRASTKLQLEYHGRDDVSWDHVRFHDFADSADNRARDVIGYANQLHARLHVAGIAPDGLQLHETETIAMSAIVVDRPALLHDLVQVPTNSVHQRTVQLVSLRAWCISLERWPNSDYRVEAMIAVPPERSEEERKRLKNQLEAWAASAGATEVVGDYKYRPASMKNSSRAL